jgi:hypothetical protein
MNTTFVVPASAVYDALRIRAYILASKFADWLDILPGDVREDVYLEMEIMFSSVGEVGGREATRSLADFQDGSLREFVMILVRQPALYKSFVEFSQLISSFS